MLKINFLNYRITDKLMLSKIRKFCVVVKEISPLRETASEATVDWLSGHLDEYIDDLELDLWAYFEKYDPNMIEGWEIGFPRKFIRTIIRALDSNEEDVFNWLDKQNER